MKTSDKIRNPTFGTDDPVLIPHEFLIVMSSEVVKLEDELGEYKKHCEPQMKMNSEVHHVMRRVGTDEAAKERLANSGHFIDTLISNYLSEGWEIQSTHLIRVVKLDRQPPQRKRWREFWKTSDRHEQDDLAFDFLWVLVR